MKPEMSYEEAKCKRCKKMYKKTTIQMNNRRIIPKGIRGYNTVNCSKKCSRK